MINTRKHITLLTSLLLSSLHVLLAHGQETQSAVTQHFDVALPQHEETSPRKKRGRKEKNKEKKAKKPATYLDMEYEQLVNAKNTQKEKGNISATIKYLEQLLKLATEVTQIAEHLLELADTFFIDNQFSKASLIYTRYCTLYPGSEKQEYALYKSVTSSFKCILSIDRDQTKTEETLGLTEVFLLQDHFTTYKEEVLQIQKQCYEQLAASECSICTYYINSRKLKAAEKRLSKMRSYWLPKLPTLEPDIIALELNLAEQKEIVEAINNKHVQVAENKKARHMSNRF